MNPRIKKFYSKAIRAYKNESDSEHDRLLTIMNAIERIQQLHTRLASDDDKQEAISKLWIISGTLQQRMIVTQSIYMDGMKREQNAQVCMTRIGETDAENWEREQLLKPHTLIHETHYDVNHVDQLADGTLLFDVDPHYCLMSKPDEPTLHLKRYGKPSHKWNVPTAFDTWKGIPYRIQSTH